MAKNYKTKKPTGLSFARKGSAITLTWKCGDSDYNKKHQLFWNYYAWKYKYNKKKKKNVGNTVKVATSKEWRNIKGTLRSYTFKFNVKSFYPYTQKLLTTISVSVRGQRKDFKQNDTNYTTQMSDYTNKQYKLEKPKAPSISQALSNDYDNRTTFSWSCEDQGGDSVRVFEDYAYETLWIKNSNLAVKDGAKAGWGKAKTISTKSKSKTFTEDSVLFQGYYSYTRWFRIRSRGARGGSEWKYIKHVYAIPPYSKNVVANVDGSSRARGYYRINVKWNSEATQAHPIDSTSIEYQDVVPTSTLTTITNEDGSKTRHAELTAPIISSGSSSVNISDTRGKDGVVLSCPTLSEKDHALVVRVNNKHDRNVSYGATTYVTKSFAKLTNPVITSVGSLDRETRRITLTATNGSEVTNTHMAIWYKDSSDIEKEYCLGIIPPGQESITLTLPETSLTETYTLGVQTRLGDHTPATHDQNVLTYYELNNELMSSTIIWGDDPVPQPPKNITLTSPKTGTIRVVWTSRWSSATGTELSWSQDEDAWESTNEPSTYVVNSTSATAWNITELDVGTWYVRIRQFKTDTNGTTYGAYSEIHTIKLAASPDTPSLTLSEPVISETGSVTCYWAYTTNDGTEQSYAEICIATPNNDGTYTYSEAIEHTNTAQYITLYAEELGWKSGDTYYLAVRVTSASGETSEEWSVPKPLIIANKINVSIIDSSLDRTEEFVEDQYFLTDDQEVVSGKIYYIRSGSDTEEDPYVYTEVVSPSQNPSEAGYYEKTAIYNTTYTLSEMPLSITLDTDTPYTLTNDTEIEEGKKYYIRTGSGTEQDPYVYTEVVTPEENPAEAGYYEETLLEGDLTVILERAEAYHITRPDESDFDGFKDETIAVINKDGAGTILIEKDDLTGSLDDGAKYNLTITLTDSYNQTFITKPLLFEVKWAHQAAIPKADIEIFTDDLYTTIVPIAPTGYEPTRDTTVIAEKLYFTRTGDGTDEDPYVYTEVLNPSGNPKSLGYYQLYDSSLDSCDIYRLSTDAPELILENVKFGSKYVDPYPTLKTFGGYRVVYKTVDGDYITEGENIGWVDYLDSEENQIDLFATVIDFSRDRIILPYDLELSNKWSKDFTETKYLGGSVQGDWNPAVSRTGSVRTTTVVFEDPDTIKAMRRLADYAGICHIRTPDGSNFTANIEVGEDRENKFIGQLAKFSLDITRVDNEDLDGELYETWIGNNG